MESSGTTSRAATENLSFCSSCATAGPERSSRSPRAQESLTVTTAAVNAGGSAIEEDIFLFFPPAWPRAARRRTRCRRRSRRCRLGFRAAISSRLVQQSQTFHQQPLGIELRRLFVGFAFEVELEISAGPAQHFEYGLVAHQLSIGRVLHLAFHKKNFALIAFVAQRQLAAFPSHLE